MEITFNILDDSHSERPASAVYFARTSVLPITPRNVNRVAAG
jgi:hypothetical protein